MAQEKVDALANNTFARAITRMVSIAALPVALALCGWIWDSTKRLGAVEHSISSFRDASTSSRMEIIGRLEVVERQNIRDAEMNGVMRENIATLIAQGKAVEAAVNRLQNAIDQERRTR